MNSSKARTSKTKTKTLSAPARMAAVPKEDSTPPGLDRLLASGHISPAQHKRYTADPDVAAFRLALALNPTDREKLNRLNGSADAQLALIADIVESEGISRIKTLAAPGARAVKLPTTDENVIDIAIATRLRENAKRLERLGIEYPDEDLARVKSAAGKDMEKLEKILDAIKAGGFGSLEKVLEEYEIPSPLKGGKRKKGKTLNSSTGKDTAAQAAQGGAGGAKPAKASDGPGGRHNTTAAEPDTGKALEPDPEEIGRACDFIRPEGLLTLNSIAAAGGAPDGHTFKMPEEREEAVAWAVSRNGAGGGRNLYFSVNEAKGKIHKKLKKSDIASVAMLHTDVDPDLKAQGGDYAAARAAVLEVGERCAAGGLSVFDSGNGIGVYARLESPIGTEAGETGNQELQQNLDPGKSAGDGTWNADRVMALPGTIKHQSVKKIERGYPPAARMVRILRINREPLALPVLETRLLAGGSDADAVTIAKEWAEEQERRGGWQHDSAWYDQPVEWSPLSEEEVKALKADFDKKLEQDANLAARWKGGTEGLKDTTRSGLDFAVARKLVELRYNASETHWLLEQFEHGTQLEQPGDRGFSRLWNRAQESAPAAGYAARIDAITEKLDWKAVTGLIDEGVDAGLDSGTIREQIKRLRNDRKMCDVDLNEVARHVKARKAVILGAAKLAAGTKSIDYGTPRKSAIKFLREEHFLDGFKTLRTQQGELFRYDGVCYLPTEIAAVRSELSAWIARQQIVVGKGETAPAHPTRVRVAEVLEATQAVTHLDRETKAPVWLKGEGPRPEESVVCGNGLLHIPSRKIIPCTPGYWNLNAVPFNYDPTAQCPLFVRFLDQLWGHDLESAQTVQEIFGLMLVNDNSYQKIFLTVGPKRSGKGTLARIMEWLVGSRNYTSVPMSALAGSFGLEALIGKQVVAVPDARSMSKNDPGRVAEAMLSISGGDTISVSRKYLPAWVGALAVRFMMYSNEIPKLLDTSGVLAARFIALRMTESFYGKEDRGLSGKLATEMPGILNWALEGWARLNERGYFEQPASGQEQLDALATASSPFQNFLDDECVFGENLRIPGHDLFSAWRVYCQKIGKKHAGNRADFGRMLLGARHEVTNKKRQQHGSRQHFYVGVSLRDDSMLLHIRDFEDVTSSDLKDNIIANERVLVLTKRKLDMEKYMAKLAKLPEKAREYWMSEPAWEDDDAWE